MIAPKGFSTVQPDLVIKFPGFKIEALVPVSMKWRIVKDCQCDGPSTADFPFPRCMLCGKPWRFESLEPKQ